MTEKRLESLDLNLLLVLHWLLTERNVTVAAGKIGLSQPATSRALARLRDIFEDPLLVKTGNEMVPTRMAEKLQPAVAHAIERFRDVLRITDHFDPMTQSGRYRVACVDYIGAMVAAAWIRAISKDAPGLDLDLVNLDVAASRDLVSGKIDLVLMPDIATLNLPPSIDVDQFVRRKIFHQDYLCAVRKGHPDMKTNITLDHYVSLDHVLVTPQGAKIGIVDSALEKHGLQRRVAYRTSSFLLALSIIQRTDCIITAPQTLLRLDTENLVLFAPPVTLMGFDMFGAWHPNWTHDERHKWVRDRLFAEIATQYS